MKYYSFNDMIFGSFEDLDLPQIPEPEKRPNFMLYQRDIAKNKAAFALTDIGQIRPDSQESHHWLNRSRLQAGEFYDAKLAAYLAEGPLKAININHPSWQRIALAYPINHSRRVNIIALGDVGATMLMGLRLLGGEVISKIGIYDLNQKNAERYEFEMNQVIDGHDYDTLPPVEVINEEQIFDCAVLIFCAAANLPPVDSQVKDVRMAQFAANRKIIGEYARKARKAKFMGFCCVVSDPVDLLCKELFTVSNTNEQGEFDGLGIRAEFIQGYGLGVMNARAAYFAKKDSRFSSFLTEGRAFGPHGNDLIIANSINNYNHDLSLELTAKAVTANMQMRKLGFKPYIAPALSSAALAIIRTLGGKWQYSSVFLGGIYMGCKNRYLYQGNQVECLPLPDKLYQRIEEAAHNLAQIN